MPEKEIDSLLKLLMKMTTDSEDPKEAVLGSYEKVTKEILTPKVQVDLQRVVREGIQGNRDAKNVAFMLNWCVAHFLLLKNGAIKVQLVRKDK